jgi:hypothetical protein
MSRALLRLPNLPWHNPAHHPNHAKVTHRKRPLLTQWLPCLLADRTKITTEDVELAQTHWADAIIMMGSAALVGHDTAKIARHYLDALYGFEAGTVLFKPTKAADAPFRLDKAGTLSYFVGGNPDYLEDKGFALEPWREVHFINADIILSGNSALAMGHYFFTSYAGNIIKVEYTFGYTRIDGVLKINLHHSSLPYHIS